MHCVIPDWNSLDSVRHAHSVLEGSALTFFALLVLFDVLAHLAKRAEEKERLFERIALFFFTVAVAAEIAAFVYGQRNDKLSEQVIRSLDKQSKGALVNASSALSKSSEAVNEASTAEGDAEAALAKSSQANLLASNALFTATAARSEFTKFRASRTISEADKTRWIERLSNFPATPFVLAVGPDSESFELLTTIKSILLAAKWKQLPAQGNVGIAGSDPLIGISVTTGILIEADASRLAAWGQQTGPMEALQELFTSSGIPANANLAASGVSPEAIHILIGNRPR
jgi:hypothetical protein